MKSTSSFGRTNSRLSNYSRTFDLPDDDHDGSETASDCEIGGAMLPIFLNDLRRNNQDELVEVTLELEKDSIVVCSVNPNGRGMSTPSTPGGGSAAGILERSLSATSRIRRKFGWLRSRSSRTTWSENEERAISARDARKLKAKLDRSKLSAQRGLKGLRFINKTTGTTSESNELWKRVESRFKLLAKDGLLAREDFGECIGMMNSKEFAVCIFDALARRKRQRITKISKEELHDFWADSNEDGRITREEVQELIMLSASANKLSKLKEQAEEYASLIMEELDPENLGYIELETLLLQRDTYMNYSRPLSTASVSWSQNISSIKPQNVMHRLSFKLRSLILEKWQRAWILSLWVMIMAGLFVWKFLQYKNKAAFHVMGYCLASAKGAAETLKFNMALILLPVCRNTLTWLRSTRARSFVPFDENINFHKMVAGAIVIGVILHAGNHLLCDFPRLINSSPENFALIASDFNNKKPTYEELVTGIEGVTGISMVVLLTIAFTLATGRFRRNGVRLPAPFNKLTGFNAFWYSHHLTGVVYILLLVHGTFLFLAHKWYQKTTWMYISAPLLLYMVERNVRTRRSEHYSVKLLKLSVLPGNVLSLILSKPQGFKYKSGQYIFLQCPAISSFEWHPFSITSAPGDDHLSVHIRVVGDWTEELKRVFTEENESPSVIGRAKFGQLGRMDQTRQPRLYVGMVPYGAQHGLQKLRYNQKDSNTENSRSDDSSNSYASSSMTPVSKKRTQRTTNAHFYWVTREPGSFEWFKGVMDEVAEMDHKGQIELHNYLTSVYEEGDARSTLITMVQALNHAKHGVDIVSGTRVCSLINIKFYVVKITVDNKVNRQSITGGGSWEIKYSKHCRG
ncbi:hypothetical protein POTOM_023361 [Populus tomentosa]|uniref:FAD-binding FR-type domain-containing protein n=1 Tax=Populus tomentosa TaxID=118781 RepID=A0A8X8CQK2_POPTO|nr:hypothetical protein POTOM_023361 [Populus tomentosa]